MLAFFDCFAGISGDMALGALIDLGVPVDWLTDQLQQMPLKQFDLKTRPLERSGIRAQRARVVIKKTNVSRNYSDIQILIQKSQLSDPVKAKSLDIFETLATAEAAVQLSYRWARLLFIPVSA